MQKNNETLSGPMTKKLSDFGLKIIEAEGFKHIVSFNEPRKQNEPFIKDILYSQNPELDLPTFDLPERIFTYDEMCDCYESGGHNEYILTPEQYLASISEIEDAEVECWDSILREGEIKVENNKITITKLIYKK